MLWYKSFLETRWRFLIGLAILLLSVTGTVLAYPRVARLLPLVPSIDTSGGIGRRIKDIADLSRTYHGYIWAQALRQNVTSKLRAASRWRVTMPARFFRLCGWALSTRCNIRSCWFMTSSICFAISSTRRSGLRRKQPER